MRSNMKHGTGFCAKLLIESPCNNVPVSVLRDEEQSAPSLPQQYALAACAGRCSAMTGMCAWEQCQAEC